MVKCTIKCLRRIIIMIVYNSVLACGCVDVDTIMHTTGPPRAVLE